MVDLDDIFKQAMILRNNKNNKNNNNNKNKHLRCKVCGSYQLVENADGDDMVCMACGALQGTQLMNDAPEFNKNNALIKAVVFKNKEDIDYVRRCVEVLHNLIFNSGGEPPVLWVEYCKKLYRNMLKERGKKLHGTSLALVCGVIIECLMIEKGTPIIRPRMIEYAINTAKSLEKDRVVSHVTYERYRSDEKAIKLRTVLKKAGCFSRKPTIYEYTVFAMNRYGFDDTRRGFVRALANALEKIKNENGDTDPMVDDVVLSKTNDEIAACLLLMASDQTHDISKVKTVHGMTVGRLKPMYDSLLKSENPTIKGIISGVNLNNKLINKRKPKPKSFFTIDGKKCTNQQKDVVVKAAVDWAKKKVQGNDNAMRLITKPNGKFLSVSELCRLMSQN